MASAARLILMERQPLLMKMMCAKRSKKLTWEQLGTKVGLSPVFVAAVCLGQVSIPIKSGEKLLEALEVEAPESNCGLTNAEILAKAPLKAQELDGLAKDPFITRLNEINNVYGLAIKEVVNEQFGDGIMSAVNFHMKVNKVPHKDGDRVEIVLSGKFLPFTEEW